MADQTTVSGDEYEKPTSGGQVTLGSFGSGGDLDRNTVPPHKNPRWLRKQYHTYGNSIPEIAVEAGVTGEEIVDRMHDFGISFVGPKIPIDAARKLFSEDWLREQYKGQRKALIDIADELDVSRQPVKKIVTRVWN